MTQTGPSDDETLRAVISALDPVIARPADGAATPERAKPKLRIVEPGDSDEPPVSHGPTLQPTGSGEAENTAQPVVASSDSERPAALNTKKEADNPPVSGAAENDAALEDAIAAASVAALSVDPSDAENSAHAKAPKPARLRPALSAAWQRWRPLAPFVLATLGPVPLLVLAGALGGMWSLFALMWMTGFLHLADEVALRRGARTAVPGKEAAFDGLSILVAVVHFALLFYAIWSLSGGAGLGFLSWVATFLAFGIWFGQVSNSNAHELIHRSGRALFSLGMWVYISILFGHHTSAHRFVHHRFVATPDDPNTAAEGEDFYSFAIRAWPGAFVAGYEMEEHLRANREAGGLAGLNPYTIYISGAMMMIAVMLTLFGFDGLLAYLLLCAHAHAQLLLSDYVQHYGLLRRPLPSGNLEPAGLGHSWDAPHPLSALMMLNAPRHADHHAHPSRRFGDLRLSPAGRTPTLPYSLPIMATIALVPPVWFRMMNRRLADLRKKATVAVTPTHPTGSHAGTGKRVRA